MTNTYSIDSSHAAAHFKVRHLMIAWVRGTFSTVSGTVSYDPANPGASHVHAEIDATSINTREANRDAHLKSADFLDAENYSKIVFESRRVESGKVTGDLTIRGVTREVTLHIDEVTPEIKDPWGFSRFGATASTKINRKDYGLTWNMALEAGGFAVGDEIEITLEVEMVRSAASTA